MTSNPLASLPKQKRELLKQIAQMQKQVEKIDRILAEAHQISAEVGKIDAKESDDGESGGGSQRHRTGARPGEIIGTAREILNSASAPLTRGQLLAAFKDRHVEVGGPNPANKLGTTLSREADTFVNLPRFGFWLCARSYAPANYVGTREDKETSGEANGGAIAAQFH